MRASVCVLSLNKRTYAPTKGRASVWAVQFCTYIPSTTGFGNKLRLQAATHRPSRDAVEYPTQATGIGRCAIYAATAAQRGQGGLELWVCTVWLLVPDRQVLLHADIKILLVQLVTICGSYPVIVAYCLESTYPTPHLATWWSGIARLL